MNKIYIAADFMEYPDIEILYKGSSKSKAEQALDQRIEDTDGECVLKLYDSEKDSEFLKERGLI